MIQQGAQAPIARWSSKQAINPNPGIPFHDAQMLLHNSTSFCSIHSLAQTLEHGSALSGLDPQNMGSHRFPASRFQWLEQPSSARLRYPALDLESTTKIGTAASKRISDPGPGQLPKIPIDIPTINHLSPTRGSIINWPDLPVEPTSTNRNYLTFSGTQNNKAMMTKSQARRCWPARQPNHLPGNQLITQSFQNYPKRPPAQPPDQTWLPVDDRDPGPADETAGPSDDLVLSPEKPGPPGPGWATTPDRV